MSSNANRDYGLNWERELVKMLQGLGAARRNPNSGAFGTQSNDPDLQGDVRFEVDGLRFLIEAKAGYGGVGSITFKREWLDKVTEEATRAIPNRIPVVALKMRGDRAKNGKLIVMSVEVFKGILEHIVELENKLEAANERLWKSLV